MDGGEDSDESEIYFSAAESIRSSTADQRGVSSPRERPADAAANGSDSPPPSDGEGKSTKKTRGRDRSGNVGASGSAKHSPLVNHALNGMNTLYVLWANEKLCDVEVEAGGVAFPAHGVVLATHSDFFLRLLLKERAGTSAAAALLRVTLGSPVTATGFGRALAFMYTSRAELSWATVGDTLSAARALSVGQLERQCGDFLRGYDAETCLAALRAAEESGPLPAELRRFVRANFGAVGRSEAFRRCPAAVAERLLADRGGLRPACSEAELLRAAWGWVRANGEAGVESAPALTGRVRFERIPAERLASLVREDGTLMEIPEVRSRLDAATATTTTTATSSSGITTTAATTTAIATAATTTATAATTTTTAMSSSGITTTAATATATAATATAATATTTAIATTTTTATTATTMATAEPTDDLLWTAKAADRPYTHELAYRVSTSNAQLNEDIQIDFHGDLDRTGPETARDGALPSTPSATQLPTAATPPASSETGGPATATGLREHGTSPTPWPMPSVGDEPPQKSTTTMKPSTVPRQAARPFRGATSPTSDYRITASNPKALKWGPVAWPAPEPRGGRKRGGGDGSDVIVTVGGVAKSGESEWAGRQVEVFLVGENEWRSLDPMPSARNHHVVHFLNGFLYVIGGSDPLIEGEDFLKPVSSVLKYDVRVGTWEAAQSMHSARIFHEVTALFGQLYVVGGQDHTGRTLATVECYSPTTDRWHYVAPLPSPRYGVAVTVHRGRLWVAGGFPREDLVVTSTVPTEVLCYSPFRDEWTPTTPLRVPRCHTSLLEMAGRLFMIGGFVGGQSSGEQRDGKCDSLSTIEAYREGDETWEFVADLWQGRHDANTVAVGDKAYIVGGMEDEREEPLPSVECFDPAAVAWAAGLAPLPWSRFGHACCTVPGDAPLRLLTPGKP